MKEHSRALSRTHAPRSSRYRPSVTGGGRVNSSLLINSRGTTGHTRPILPGLAPLITYPRDNERFKAPVSGENNHVPRRLRPICNTRVNLKRDSSRDSACTVVCDGRRKTPGGFLSNAIRIPRASSPWRIAGSCEPSAARDDTFDSTRDFLRHASKTRPPYVHVSFTQRGRFPPTPSVRRT